MIRVLVVDDHAVVRRGIVQIIGEAPDMLCAGEAGTGRDALRLARQNDYDLVVLDIRLPDSNGIEVLKQLRLLNPRLPVLMLSMYPEQQYATRALKAGAAGYLTKDSLPEELLIALNQVAGGGHYLSRAFTEVMVAQLGGDPSHAAGKALTDREDQVLRLLGAGKTVSQIGRDLALSVKTVSTYRTRLLQKLGLKTTAELVRYALENDLAD